MLYRMLQNTKWKYYNDSDYAYSQVRTLNILSLNIPYCHARMMHGIEVLDFQRQQYDLGVESLLLL